MININIKATNLELTPAIRAHIESKVNSLQKFLSNSETQMQVEVAKTTNHHKKGEVYKTEFGLLSKGKKFFVSSENEDIYATIDEAREIMVRELIHHKKRDQTLFKRGATSVKKMLKGLSDRNPFTSK